MGLNRFSTTGTSEYTSQHVPLPFDTISKVGEQVKLEHDTADAAAAAGNRSAGGRLRDGLPGPDRSAACQDRAYGVGFAASHRAARREQGMCHCKTIYR